MGSVAVSVFCFPSTFPVWMCGGMDKRIIVIVVNWRLCFIFLVSVLDIRTNSHGKYHNNTSFHFDSFPPAGLSHADFVGNNFKHFGFWLEFLAEQQMKIILIKALKEGGWFGFVYKWAYISNARHNKNKMY